jgi:hypothetical protein
MKFTIQSVNVIEQISIMRTPKYLFYTHLQRFCIRMSIYLIQEIGDTDYINRERPSAKVRDL